MGRNAPLLVLLALAFMPLTRSEAATTLTVPQEVSRVAGTRSFHQVLEWLRAHTREIAERQLELTAIPAPPFHEQKRAEWVAERFREMGLENVHVDEAGNVLGVRPGTDAQARYLAVCAHIDTVFPEGTKLEVRREATKLVGPGISDNGAGVSALLAVAQALAETKTELARPIVFVGNVGEEGEGDLRGMRHLFSGVWKERIEHTLILDGAATDTIVAQALGSRRFEVTVRGPGGHSWSDFGTPNPVVALARAIAEFSRTQVPADPKTTYNIGVVRGGTSVNSIPESATMRVDIRSAATEEIDRVERALREAVSAALRETSSAHHMLSAEVRMIGFRPAAELKPEARVLQVVQAVDAQLGNKSRIQRASTDANVPMAMGLEAVAMGAGGTGGGAHTLHEWYDPTNRDLGFKRIVLTLMTLAGVE